MSVLSAKEKCGLYKIKFALTGNKKMKCDLSDDGRSHFYWSEVTFCSTKGHLRFAMPLRGDFMGKTGIFIAFHL